MVSYFSVLKYHNPFQCLSLMIGTVNEIDRHRKHTLNIFTHTNAIIYIHIYLHIYSNCVTHDYTSLSTLHAKKKKIIIKEGRIKIIVNISAEKHDELFAKQDKKSVIMCVHVYVCSCFDEQLAEGKVQDSPMMSKKMSTSQHITRRRKLDPRIVLDSDLEGGALEVLRDIPYVIHYKLFQNVLLNHFPAIVFHNRTLFLFEQFLFTSKGPSSGENACYKMWKAITQFQKTLPKKHDSLAVHIYKTFISVDSKFHLPGELCEFLDKSPEQFSDSDKLRPKSTTFVQLKILTEEFLVPAINEFLSTRERLNKFEQQENRKVYTNYFHK